MSTPSSPKPPAATLPLAVYDGEELVLILVAAAARLYGAAPGGNDLGPHPFAGGRFVAARLQEKLLEVVRSAPDFTALRARLEADGYRVRPTPVSALTRWLPRELR